MKERINIRHERKAKNEIAMIYKKTNVEYRLFINKEDNNIIEEFEEEDYKPRKRGSKTHRNRKSNGASKRRY